jgi:predicted phosphoribosyltransferase
MGLLGALADDVVCLRAPSRFAAVGEWYDDFRQVEDDEVRVLLRAAGKAPPSDLSSGR